MKYVAKTSKEIFPPPEASARVNIFDCPWKYSSTGAFKASTSQTSTSKAAELSRVRLLLISSHACRPALYQQCLPPSSIHRSPMTSCADLIQLLQRPSSSPSEQQEAAAALSTLPMTPQVWSVAVGALPRLVELMQHHDSTEGIRGQAKRALHHVTDYASLLPGGQVQATSATDLSALVELLRGNSGVVQSEVMSTLATLAQHDYNRGQIIETGAIGRLAQLLKSSMKEVHLSAARVLCHLSREPNTQALFEGALPSLTRLLKSSSVDVQRAAVSTLSNIAIDANGMAAVAAAGAVPPIVHLLNSKAAIVQEEAATALKNLGNVVANQASIAAAGAIPPLVLMLKSRSEAVQTAAAAALCNLTFSPAVQARVVSAGAVTPLAHLLKSRSAAVQGVAVRALSNLSHHPNSAAQISAAGAIDSLVPHLEAASPAALHDVVLIILGNLTVVAACRAQLVAAGVVPHLVRLLSSGSEQQQRQASTYVGNLAAEDTGRLRVLAAGAIEPLVKLLRSDSEAVQLAAVTALMNLLAQGGNVGIQQDKLASYSAAVAPLVLLLRCKSEEARERAVRVLLTLTGLPGGHSRAIAAAGGIPPLFEILENGSEQVQLLAVTLLHFIALEGAPSDLVAMERAGALPILAKLQGDAKHGSDMLAMTSILLKSLGSVGSSSRSTKPSGPGSTKGGGKSDALPPFFPSSPSSSVPSASSIPPATAAAASAACPRPPATAPQGRGKLCWSCGATGVPLKKCSVCTVAAYCGAACQKADWKAHKGQCAGLKASAAACKD